MKILRVVCVCFLGTMAALAQDTWRRLPTLPRGPNDTDQVGVSIPAIAKRGIKESRARVVISVARKWRTAEIGIWIDNMSEVIAEKELWPYMGPDLGHEAKNPQMMRFKLVSPKGEVRFSSRMIMSSGGNFPTGVAGDGEFLFATNCSTDKRFKTFLGNLDNGFDYGEVVIGRGVFSPPIEIKFVGNGIKGHLKEIVDILNASGTEPHSGDLRP